MLIVKHPGVTYPDSGFTVFLWFFIGLRFHGHFRFFFLLSFRLRGSVRLGRPGGVIDGGDDANSGGEWSPAHRGPSTSIFDRL